MQVRWNRQIGEVARLHDEIPVLFARMLDSGIVRPDPVPLPEASHARGQEDR